MRNWREVIDKDFPDINPITEKTRQVTVAAAQHGIRYAVEISQNPQPQYKYLSDRFPRIYTFMKGIIESIGFNRL
jgi:hypothetical protein